MLSNSDIFSIINVAVSLILPLVAIVASFVKFKQKVEALQLSLEKTSEDLKERFSIEISEIKKDLQEIKETKASAEALNHINATIEINKNHLQEKVDDIKQMIRLNNGI